MTCFTIGSDGFEVNSVFEVCKSISLGILDWPQFVKLGLIILVFPVLEEPVFR